MPSTKVGHRNSVIFLHPWCSRCQGLFVWVEDLHMVPGPCLSMSLRNSACISACCYMLREGVLHENVSFVQSRLPYQKANSYAA